MSKVLKRINLSKAELIRHEQNVKEALETSLDLEDFEKKLPMKVMKQQEKGPLHKRFEQSFESKR